jgi:hypothetical protein
MSLAGDALNGIALWITRKERQQERDDAAVKAVLTAVNKTKEYIAGLDRGERIDRTEKKLVKLWTTQLSTSGEPTLIWLRGYKERLSTGRIRRPGQIKKSLIIEFRLTKLPRKEGACSAGAMKPEASNQGEAPKGRKNLALGVSPGYVGENEVVPYCRRLSRSECGATQETS